MHREDQADFHSWNLLLQVVCCSTLCTQEFYPGIDQLKSPCRRLPDQLKSPCNCRIVMGQEFLKQIRPSMLPAFQISNSCLNSSYKELSKQKNKGCAVLKAAFLRVSWVHVVCISCLFQPEVLNVNRRLARGEIKADHAERKKLLRIDPHIPC